MQYLVNSSDLESLTIFRSLLPARARVLDAGCGAGIHSKWLHDQECEVLGVDLIDPPSEQNFPFLKKDLRFFSTDEGSYDGIWCHRVFPSMKSTEMQRVLALFFKILIPEGKLFVSYRDWAAEEGTQKNETAFLSLLRQSGFTSLMQAEVDFGDGAEKAVVARRSA